MCVCARVIEDNYEFSIFNAQFFHCLEIVHAVLISPARYCYFASI